ncbi:MAG TPA: hypothetical protein VH255_08640, partial [Verrucomicrobiae bacterium]|nr:hypothetical protein [Verrucomicrobiae bacterium]
AANATNTADDFATRKEDVIATMRVDLDRLKAQMNVLGAKIQSGSETVKAEAQPKLEALREKIADLDQQLDKAKDASASKWDEFKAGFEKSSADVKNSLSEARDWVSEKISPAASTN